MSAETQSNIFGECGIQSERLRYMKIIYVCINCHTYVPPKYLRKFCNLIETKRLSIVDA